jgi:hypothetical protein
MRQRLSREVGLRPESSFRSDQERRRRVEDWRTQAFCSEAKGIVEASTIEMKMRMCRRGVVVVVEVQVG